MNSKLVDINKSTKVHGTETTTYFMFEKAAGFFNGMSCPCSIIYKSVEYRSVDQYVYANTWDSIHLYGSSGTTNGVSDQEMLIKMFLSSWKCWMGNAMDLNANELDGICIEY